MVSWRASGHKKKKRSGHRLAWRERRLKQLCRKRFKCCWHDNLSGIWLAEKSAVLPGDSKLSGKNRTQQMRHHYRQPYLLPACTRTLHKPQSWLSSLWQRRICKSWITNIGQVLFILIFSFQSVSRILGIFQWNSLTKDQGDRCSGEIRAGTN